VKELTCPIDSTVVCVLSERDGWVKCPTDKCGGEVRIGYPKLSLNRLQLLSDLLRAVQSSSHQSGVKLRWYPCGTDFGSNVPRQMDLVMRAFTHQDGTFLSDRDDVREAYVWFSGFTERWIKVEEVLDALDNAINGTNHDQPMAVIDYPPKEGN